MSLELKGQYAEVNGINLYFEIHGSGEALILLHGGIGAIEMFGDVLSSLAKNRQVIAVDLQAHGRTLDVDRPLRCETMADDIAALIQRLGLKQVDLMGYSLGGAVAQQVAIRHSELLRRLVIVSSPCKRSGWYPEIVAGMGQMGAAAAEPMKQTPMYALYSQIAPRVEDWPVLLAKMGELLQIDYDWSDEIAKIQIPTLLVIGDADSVRTAHAVEFFELLGGGKLDGNWDGSGMSKAQLAILPATTHYNIFYSPALAATVIPFLDAALSPKP